MWSRWDVLAHRTDGEVLRSVLRFSAAPTEIAG
jgi:hypothetical protein